MKRRTGDGRLRLFVLLITTRNVFPRESLVSGMLQVIDTERCNNVTRSWGMGGKRIIVDTNPPTRPCPHPDPFPDLTGFYDSKEVMYNWSMNEQPLRNTIDN